MTNDLQIHFLFEFAKFSKFSNFTPRAKNEHRYRERNVFFEFSTTLSNLVQSVWRRVRWRHIDQRRAALFVTVRTLTNHLGIQNRC